MIFDSVARRKRKRKINIIPREDIERIIQISKSKIQNDNRTLAIALAMYAGLTASEISALKWEDVDLVKRVITVSKSVQRISVDNCNYRTMLVTHENKRTRVIPINKSLQEFFILGRFFHRNDYVISNGESDIPNPISLEHYITVFYKVSLEDLRNWFCIQGIKQQVPIIILSNFAGISLVTFYKKYNEFIEYSESDEKSAIEKIKL